MLAGGGGGIAWALALIPQSHLGFGEAEGLSHYLQFPSQGPTVSATWEVLVDVWSIMHWQFLKNYGKN